MLAFLNGLTAGLALVIPLGLIAVLLVTLSAKHGWRVGLSAGLGAATTDGIYAAVAVTAGAVVAPWIEAAGPWLRWISVALLIGIAVMIAKPLWSRQAAGASDAEVDEPSRMSARRAFLLLIGLTAANPATIVYFAALIAGGGAGQLTGGLEPALWVLGVFLASAGWGSMIALAGSRLGRWVRSTRGRQWTAAIGALLICFLAVKVAVGF